ncbi:MAG: hypothetical protein ABW069_05445 [Duganella sp.]
MNARHQLVVQPGATAPSHDAVWHAAQQLLAAFARAPRMCHLLSFLIEKKLAGREHEITEYAIGLQVFRRDARTYDTTLDPVVRVQVGRLRARLDAYQSGADAGADVSNSVRITLPLGSYVPCFGMAESGAHCRRRALQLSPLRNLCFDTVNQGFVRGIDEELGARLFESFGNVTPVAEANLLAPVALQRGPQPLHRLEGSIRIERDHVRAAMRLLDTQTGHIVWLSQFDRQGELGMTMQAELAGAICAALQQHLLA